MDTVIARIVKENEIADQDIVTNAFTYKIINKLQVTNPILITSHNFV